MTPMVYFSRPSPDKSYSVRDWAPSLSLSVVGFGGGGGDESPPPAEARDAKRARSDDTVDAIMFGFTFVPPKLEALKEYLNAHLGVTCSTLIGAKR